jgi:Domain of unknown function (DUF4397)
VSSRINRSWLLCVATAVLAACSDSANGPGGGTAQFRALHVTPTLGPVDVLVGGVAVVSGLTFGQTSPAVTITGGRQRFLVRSGGQLLGDLQFSLAADHVNSMVISDSAPQFSTFVEPDTGQAEPTRANIRLVNVVGSNNSAPTLLNVLIKAPNADPDSIVTSNLDATVAAYWSLMYFDPGEFNIKYVPAGQPATVLTEVTFDVAAGEKKAVVLSRADDGSYHVAVVVEP